MSIVFDIGVVAEWAVLRDDGLLWVGFECWADEWLCVVILGRSWVGLEELFGWCEWCGWCGWCGGGLGRRLVWRLLLR